MVNCHYSINAHRGFGVTIRAINPSECAGGNPSAVNARVGFYEDYCNQFQVDLGTYLTCNLASEAISSVAIKMVNCHYSINAHRGFGVTIRAINPSECAGGNPSAVNARVGFYEDYCNQFQVDLGTYLTCNLASEAISSVAIKMVNCHYSINAHRGFGVTIRAINPSECAGGNPSAVNARVGFYEDYCNQFQVDLGTYLTCNLASEAISSVAIK
ncbi:endochitinase EP3-like, partial [Olea europaea subsp. europaea]